MGEAPGEVVDGDEKLWARSPRLANCVVVVAVEKSSAGASVLKCKRMATAPAATMSANRFHTKEERYDMRAIVRQVGPKIKVLRFIHIRTPDIYSYYYKI